MDIDQIVFNALSDILSDSNNYPADISMNELLQLKSTVENSGFFNLLLPESENGAELSFKQILKSFYLEGERALPLEFVSTNFARLWLYRNNVEIPSGNIAIEILKQIDGLESIGLKPKSFKKTVDWVLCIKDGQVLLINSESLLSIDSSSDMTKEWLVIYSSHYRVLSSNQERCYELEMYAALRSIAICVGAMQQTLKKTIGFIQDRQQFGRKLGQFQAIQQQVSFLVELCSSCCMAAELAYVSNNKVRKENHLKFAVNQINLVAIQFINIAHALHGAIGITNEYPLQVYTKLIRQHSLCYANRFIKVEKFGEQLLTSNKGVLEFLTDEWLVV